jgi:protein-glucosylgalactosylhydroxylysine glucosidase
VQLRSVIEWRRHAGWLRVSDDLQPRVKGDDVSEIISPEPVTEWHPGDLPPYLSNGLIGLRLGSHPMADGVTVVSGLAAVDPAAGIQTFAQAPYPLALDIMVKRVSLAGAPQRCVLR